MRDKMFGLENHCFYDGLRNLTFYFRTMIDQRENRSGLPGWILSIYNFKARL